MRFQTVAYVRVSSVDQHTDRQVAAVGEVDRAFTDYLSGGSREERVALVEMLDYVRDGDTVRVASMDRLARSVIDLAQLVGQCTDKGVTVEFVGEGLTFTKDADNPYAMFQLHMLGAVAQLERSLIRERQRQGIAVARAKSTYKGRLPVLNGEQIATARASLALKVPKAQIARDLGVSRSALYDALGSRGAYARSCTTADPVGQAPPAPADAVQDPATVLEAVPKAVRDVAREPAGDVVTAAGGPGEPAQQIPPPASTTTTTTTTTTSTAAKKPRARRAGKKRWFVVEVAAGQADDVEAEVVIMSTYATKAGADRARGRLQVKARGDLSRDEVVAVRGEDQIHRYRAWDATHGRGVTKQGPPPR